MNATQSKSSRQDFPPARGQEHNALQPWDDLVAYVRNYVREEPEVTAYVCLGVGFILGWKLKPW